MPFPLTWLQAWFPVPSNVYATASSMLFWFSYAGDIDPIHWDMAQLWRDTLDWYATGWYPYLTCPVPQNAGVNVYLSLSSSAVLPYFGYEDVAMPYDTLPALPARLCVIMRRATGFPGRSQIGRLFISGVRLDHAPNGVLKDYALDAYQDKANKLLLPFVSQGFTFFPALVSYKLGTMTPIVSHSIQARLGQVNRRNKSFRGSSAPHTYKLPPP